MIRFICLFCLIASMGAAETIVASHTVRPNSVLTAEDLAIAPEALPGGVDDMSLLIGQEARVALYQGRPIRLSEVGPPAIVKRNQIIPLSYQVGGLTISTEARALDRAVAGDIIRVMNMSSRTTVSARITTDGIAIAGGAQ